MGTTGFTRVGIQTSFHAVDITATGAGAQSTTFGPSRLPSLIRLTLIPGITNYTINFPAALTLQNASLDEIRMSVAAHFTTAGQTVTLHLPATDSFFCYGGQDFVLTALAADDCQEITIQSPPRVVFDVTKFASPAAATAALKPTQWTIESCCGVDTGTTGTTGGTGATGPSGTVSFASFFGMTAGPGNTTPTTDYPAAITASTGGPTVAATTAINFPRLSAPVVGGIVINNPGAAQTNNTEFRLPNAGTYRVSWHISVDEPVQWALFIGTAAGQGPGGTFSAHATALGRPSSVGQATGTAQLVGDVVFATASPNTIIQIRNCAAAGGTATVTPIPGGTQAQAVVIIIQQLA